MRVRDFFITVVLGVMLTLMVVLASGCTLTSKILDGQYHREAWISEAGLEGTWQADAIRRKEIRAGMTLAECRISRDVGTTWFQLGTGRWVVGGRLLLYFDRGVVVGMERYGFR